MSRRMRRIQKQEVRRLAARSDDLRARLAVSDAEVAAAERGREDIVAGVHARIEEFVDSLAQLLDTDTDATSTTFRDDDQLHKMIAEWSWRGATTAEEARDLLNDEVAHRSVGKSDLAVLLSSVDHTAGNLHETMPDSLRDLRGAALVDAVVRTLDLEDFAETLVQDSNWKEMRRRWVRLGWRGAIDDAAFGAAFIRECAERVTVIQDQGSLFDTVNDDKLARVPHATRDRMIEAFTGRLAREWELLPPRRGAGVGAAAPTGQTTPRHESAETQSAAVVTTGGRQADYVFGPGRAYSDHAMMRVGRSGWEQTYGKGMSDREAWEYIAGRSPHETEDSLGLFLAKWAVHAFQRLTTTHTFAAALMCSDAQRDVLDGIERQWDAFMVIVPNGMLVADVEFSRVLVARYQDSTYLMMLAVQPDGQIRLAGQQATDLPSLLSTDGSDLFDDERMSSQVKRCLVMAKRLVAGLLLNLQHPPTFKIRQVEARPKGHRREAEPEHRIVTIGRPLEIDCRASVREYIERGQVGRKHGAPTVQVMVRGHFRRQPCGVGRMDRKTIWIEPFWRGPEAALIQTRAKAVP